MNREQQLDAIRNGLAAVDNAMARVQAQLPFATGPDLKRLNAQLAALRSRHFNLNMQLANLEAAATTFKPLGDDESARLQALSDALDDAILDRAGVAATIDFAAAVLEKAGELQQTLA